MTINVPFIGREDITQSILAHIHDRNIPYIICIDGEGGIGKTRLLHEIYDYCTQKKDDKILTFDVVDFDDQISRSPRNIGRKIAIELDEDVFSSYLIAQNNYKDLQRAGIGPKRLQEERQKISDLFIKCFNHVSDKLRIVLLYDTTDPLTEEHGIYRDFCSIGTHLNNSVILLAGRNAKKIGERLQKEKGSKVVIIELKPFSEEESLQYIHAKEKQRLVRIPEEISPKLISLSRGKPILIDLAVEWLTYSLTIDWIADIPFFDITTEETIKNFEKQLVMRIRDVRQPMDRLVLIMSHVYPLNIDAIGYFIKSANSTELFEQAKELVFVKTLSNAQICLHDEMRRMVREYLFPENDLLATRELRNYSKLASEYYNQQIRKQQQRRKQEKDPVKRLEIIKERNELFMQWVYHSMFFDVEQGVSNYGAIIWQLKNEKRFQVALRLQAHIQGFITKFTQKQKFQYDILQARLLTDTGQPQKAEGVLKGITERLQDEFTRKKIFREQSRFWNAMYERSHLSKSRKISNVSQDSFFKRLERGFLPDEAFYSFSQGEQNLYKEEYADIYNAFAVTEVKLGELQSALAYQLDCLRLCKELNKLAIIPNVENYTGYIYEQLGKLDEAKDYFQMALSSVLQLQTPSADLIASILSNLSNICRQTGYYAEAQKYGSIALNIWQGLDSEAQIARGEITLAALERDNGNYEEATRRLSKSINILERLEDKDFHSLIKAYFHLGWTEWYRGSRRRNIDSQCLKDAMMYLEKAQQLAESFNDEITLPGLLHQLSHVYWLLGEKKLARTTNEKSFNLSLDLGDVRFAIDSLVAKAEFDYSEGKFDEIAKHSLLLKKKFGRYENEYPLFYGRIKRIEADIAFEEANLKSNNEKKYQEAFDGYIDSLAQIRRHSKHTGYFILHELDLLAMKLASLPVELASEYVVQIKQEWNMLTPKEMYSVMIVWCEEQLVNTKLRSMNIGISHV